LLYATSNYLYVLYGKKYNLSSVSSGKLGYSFN